MCAEVGRLLDAGEPVGVALGLQRRLELEVAVEVVLERTLVAAGDHEDVGAARPATASSTTYWMAGLSTTGSISLGVALVAGRKRVPSPAAGMTAFVGRPLLMARI